MSISNAFLIYRYIRDRTSEDYLYNDWNEGKYNRYLRDRALMPFYSGMADRTIGKHSNEYYMHRNGLTWDDVKQPWNLPGYALDQSGYNDIVNTVRRGINFVSSNVTRLYNDASRESRSEAYDRGFKNANNYWRNFHR